MSCNFQLICVETCVIAILRNLFCFIFQSLLMAIGTAFLYNVDEFKIYSTYCANHSKAQKALHQSELFNQPLSLMILSWRNSSRNFQTFTDCSGVYSGPGVGVQKRGKAWFLLISEFSYYSKHLWIWKAIYGAGLEYIVHACHLFNF